MILLMLTSLGNVGFISKHEKTAGSSRRDWLGREGSNLRMPESKSGALPLGDAPFEGGL